MALFLEQLEHQRKAMDAVLNAMAGCRGEIGDSATGGTSQGAAVGVHADTAITNVHANPPIRLNPAKLRTAQLPGSKGGKNIDVKMETGTGKTYVYTRLMHELYKNFGLNKFIIFVPSLPIKEGIKNFINADYARQHFSSLYENVRMDLDIVNAGSFNTKKGRKTLPGELIDYLEGSRNQHNTIKCLLLNDAMLLSKSMTRDDYDQTLFGGLSCPVKALEQTRPIVIIDEPHRFKKDGKAYKAIEALNPQLIIRFGATFPNACDGGKDYENLVYNLGSVQAFNDGLVKGIDIHYPNVDANAAGKQYKVKTVAKREKKVELIRESDGKVFEIKHGDTFPEEFDGMKLGLDDDNDLAINALKLNEGQILLPSVFATSYQELLLSQAIEKHFSKEKENWLREKAGVNAPKIKTLSLFFIDSIKSYRGGDGWLKTMFEKLLKDKLRSLIAAETDAQYKTFLEASITHLSETHAGYFAEDAGKGDEALQQEVDDILRNKEEMLSFKRKDGTWNIRRFLFSKWTLREGWDNPNVFVITKLRTSGSEISKLQEVGRGLRLPVDEHGKRLSAEEFRLDYIIDWSEKGFAKKLVGEINDDTPLRLDTTKVTEKTIEFILRSQGENVEKLRADAGAFSKRKNAIFEKLHGEGVIQFDHSFEEGGYEKMLGLFPKLEETMRVQKGKVRENPGAGRPVVKLRKENWDKIRVFWEKVTRRYMLEFEKLGAGELEALLDEVLRTTREGVETTFVESKMEIHTDIMCGNENGDGMILKESNLQINSDFSTLPYGKFLSILHRQTCLPLSLLHRKIGEKLSAMTAAGSSAKPLINTRSAANFVRNFQGAFQRAFQQRYTYRALDFSARTSVFDATGTLRAELDASAVGTNEAKDVNDDARNLYAPPFRFDSELEHDVLKLNPRDEVVVFGKLPRRSIKVPTYTGGTTTPDFVYAIKRKDERDVSLHLLVETKPDDVRGAEQIAINAQKKAFDKMFGVKWDLANAPGDVSGMLQLLIDNKQIQAREHPQSAS
ncbi:MAG: type III restriction-modification system endonuclease [Puniceicoccales bacterium]|jgi:type III restriction enzyme|nr:type III restriction-modification system endonuclease [Puniceicoccales bacterium]